MLYFYSHRVNSEDVSAVAPGDYAKITDLNVQFAANELEKEVPVTIVDDNDEEGPEKFKLVLSTTDPGATVDKDVTVVNIEDNDGESEMICEKRLPPSHFIMNSRWLPYQ